MAVSFAVTPSVTVRSASRDQVSRSASCGVATQTTRPELSVPPARKDELLKPAGEPEPKGSQVVVKKSFVGGDNAKQSRGDNKRHRPEPKDCGTQVFKRFAFSLACFVIFNLIERLRIVCSRARDAVVPRAVPVVSGEHGRNGNSPSDRTQAQYHDQNKRVLGTGTGVRVNHGSGNRNESRLDSGDHPANAVGGSEFVIFVSPLLFVATTKIVFIVAFRRTLGDFSQCSAPNTSGLETRGAEF